MPTQTTKNLIVILVTGSVLIAATWKFSGDMRSKAEAQLKTEIAVTAEWNRQHAVLQDLEKRLKAEAERREFDTFVGRPAVEVR